MKTVGVIADKIFPLAPRTASEDNGKPTFNESITIISDIKTDRVGGLIIIACE